MSDHVQDRFARQGCHQSFRSPRFPGSMGFLHIFLPTIVKLELNVEVHSHRMSSVAAPALNSGPLITIYSLEPVPTGR